VAVLMLALGIGVNTAIFSVIDTLMLKKLRVAEPERLVFVRRLLPRGRGSPRFSRFTFEQFRDRNHVFAGIFATDGSVPTVSVDGQPAEMLGTDFCSGNYYSVLGVPAFVGRTFTDDDDRHRNPVVVISHDFWVRRFAADPSAVGKSIEAKGIPFTIIGVTPSKFTGMSVEGAPELTMPLSWMDRFQLNDSTPAVLVTARLKRGVTEQQAQAELSIIYQQILKEGSTRVLDDERQSESLSHGIELRPADKGWPSRRNEYSMRLTLLTGAVGLVLLIACANIANLLLARARVRQKEIAVRLAIGASPARLMRQLLTECTLLAIFGGTLGLLLAFWGRKLLLSTLSLELNVALDFRVMGFTAIVSMVTGFLFGLAPALQATRVDLVAALKDSFKSPRNQLGKALVITQVVLSLPLLFATGLLVSSLQKLNDVDPGFDQKNILLFWVYPTTIGYEGATEIRLYDDLLEKFKAIPSVLRASMARHNLMQGGYEELRMFAEPNAGSSPKILNVAGNAVAPGFFVTMGIPTLLGRDFSTADRANTPKVAIVTQSVAETCFPNENAIGKQFRLQSSEVGERIEVVGVVRDTRYYSLRQDFHHPQGQVFLPFTQVPRDMLGQMTFELRTTGNPQRILPDVRRQVQAIEKRLPVVYATTQADEVKDSVREERSLATLIGFFGLVALLLASIGLYGVMAYTVVHRTNEIGIRVALGAGGTDVLWLVLRETLLLVALGIGIGLPAALAATRLIRNQLFGLAPYDPATIAVVTLLLIVVACIVGYLPALRASRVDPMVALRHE
jgi:putative ABC transport system permease protein